jgi:hydroxymethylpyrimidine/phosphomethylpyrimidine kinase
LTIAGSDPSGGAGLQADVVVFARHRVHPMAVPSALTVQNSAGVTQVEPLDAERIRTQLQALLTDMPPHAAKTGMLGDERVVRVVAETVAAWPCPHLVVDPVILASDGTPLLSEAGLAGLIGGVLPHATLITPNRHEAETLWGHRVATPEEAARCARALLELGPKAVLVTGGHLDGWDSVVDTLADGEGVTTWRHPRRTGPGPHGTGCALSAAITANLALGVPLRESVRRALAYVAAAVADAFEAGGGRPYLGDGSRGMEAVPTGAAP